MAKPKFSHVIWVGLVTFLSQVGLACAMDSVCFVQDRLRRTVDGQVIVEAQDGGLLLLGRDGVLWTVQPDQLLERVENDEPFVALDAGQLARELLAELPAGFDVYHTAHYSIFFNTSKTYAEWCGSLYERLYRAFYNYWRRRGIELTDPKWPLVAVIFEDRASYARHSQVELAQMAGSIVGYYSLHTNRITTYDLTGLEGLRWPGSRPKTSELINQVLSQPKAEPSVATLIHEATHQLAYNSGLQTRYADNPLWLSEGLAVYFETPDLRSAKGWRGIGAINQRRLAQFQRFLPQRPPDALEQLIAQDRRLRDLQQASDAYAESWALCYFLLTRHQRQFVSYVRELSEKEPLASDSPQQRVAAFERHFGNLRALDAQFVPYFTSRD
jgi:hypothetical protein